MPTMIVIQWIGIWSHLLHVLIVYINTANIIVGHPIHIISIQILLVMLIVQQRVLQKFVSILVKYRKRCIRHRPKARAYMITINLIKNRKDVNMRENRMNLHDWLMSLSSHSTFGYGGEEEAVSVSIWFETVMRLKGLLRQPEESYNYKRRLSLWR